MRENIVVGIRIRPISGSEERQAAIHHLKEKTCIQASPRDPSVRVTDPLSINSQRVYSYDAVLDSSNSSNRRATREDVYQALGRQLVDRACEGFNTCLLAYGVVGTGKTYTLHGIPGNREEEGIVPRFLRDVFEHSDELHLSYYELYNDRLHDLLRPSEQHEELLVHHHPKIGVYIENLTENACNSPQSAMDLLKFGHKMRSASNTNLNSHGSRSHTILRLRFEIEGRMTTALFVDLAGLEDSKHSEIGVHKLKELSFVNKSLFELANCIHSLSTNHHRTGQPVPFRNSKLTLLLSDCLMGNCKTHMLATISPAAVAYHSTVSTLRFASTVKGIKCKCTPVTKGNRNECLMKLEEEVADLKSQLACLKDDHPAAGLCTKEVERSIRAVSTVRDKYRQEWSDAIKEASVHSDQRIGLLKRLGLPNDGEEPVEPSTGRLYPFLMDLGDAAYVSGGKLLYFLSNPCTTIGSSDTDTITLRGAGIEPSMVTIHRKYIPRDGGSAKDLHLTASVPSDLPSARVLVNGRRVACGSVCELHQGDRLLVGHARVFRIVTPADGESVEHHTKLHEASAREAHKKGLPTPLEVALNEIEDDESVEFTRLRPVICRMLEDSEADQAQLFLRRLHPACSLIDEANRLTHEIRPQDNLAFELAVMQTAVPESVQYSGANGESPVRSSRSSPIRRSALFSPKSAHSAAESPRKVGLPVEELVLPMTLVVRLIQRPPPKIGTEDMVKWRKAVNDVVEKIRARKRLEPHAVSPTLSTSVHGLSQEVANLLGISPSRDAEPLHNALSDGNGHVKAGAALPTAPMEISVWSFAKFEQRLSQIRDIHRLTTGDDCIDFEHYLAENPGGDPWRDWGPQSVSAMLYRIADLERRLEHAISERGREEQIRALREQVTTLEAEHLASRKLDLEKDLREIEKIEQIEVKAYASKYSA